MGRVNPWMYPANDEADRPLVVEGELVTAPAADRAPAGTPVRPKPAALRPPRGTVPALAEADRIQHWSGPVRRWLPGHGPDSPKPSWWWLGCHGGAGVSTLARLIPGGADAARGWPNPRFGGPARVVLVARGDACGLRAALNATRQWASHDVPPIDLLGAVVVADAPERWVLHPVQEEQLVRLRGALGAVWRIPWIEDLRRDTASSLRHPPPEIGQLAADLAALIPTAREEKSSC